jgi:hypothetical protein
MDCGLFHLMEDFILKEVDYSQQYGYSSRAKRHMRRKLNKELAPYLENETDSESEPESLILSNSRVDICLGVGYICVVVTFYSAIMYFTQAYSHEKSCSK